MIERKTEREREREREGAMGKRAETMKRVIDWLVPGEEQRGEAFYFGRVKSEVFGNHSDAAV